MKLPNRSRRNGRTASSAAFGRNWRPLDCIRAGQTPDRVGDDAATEMAADGIARLRRKKPNAALGLATGSTPLLRYRVLVEMKRDWRKVTTFNLEEYAGLAREHPQSYPSFRRENLFRHENIAKQNVQIPDKTLRKGFGCHPPC